MVINPLLFFIWIASLLHVVYIAFISQHLLVLLGAESFTVSTGDHLSVSCVIQCVYITMSLCF